MESRGKRGESVLHFTSGAKVRLLWSRRLSALHWCEERAYRCSLDTVSLSLLFWGSFSSFPSASVAEAAIQE